MALLERKTEERTPAQAIVASARKIDLADKKATKAAIGRRKDWQADAWVVYDSVGEIKYVDNFLANAVGRLRAYPAVRMSADEGPIPIEDSNLSDTVKAAARDALDRMRAEVGGQGALQRMCCLNLEVAGELFMLGFDPVEAKVDADGKVTQAARPERWEVRSISEIIVESDGAVKIKASPHSPAETIPEGTSFTRIWEPHAQWQDEPDSPLHGVLAEADELLILSRSIRAQGRSRIPAGILLVPTELSFGPLDPTQDETEDVFAQRLLDAMIQPVGDESDPSALVPMVVRGKADFLDKVRHLLMDRPIDAVAAGQRQELLARIAGGLNAPPELITGMGQVNHWTAWQVDQSTFSAHIEPRAIGIFDAWTCGPYRALLRAYPGVSEADADRVFIWYDESEVVTQPNRGQDAKDAHDRNALSDEALRKALNFNDTDAPDADELARRMGLRRGIFDGAITESLLQYLLGEKFVEYVENLRGTQIAIEAEAKDTTTTDGAAPADVPPAPDLPDQQQPEGDGTGTTAEEPAVAASAAPVRHVGRQLNRLDVDLFTRLRIAADSALARALERAGARLRSKAGRTAAARTAVEGVRNELVAATLGPAVVAALEATDDELLDGAFDGLREQWDAWVADVQGAALDITAEAFGAPEDRLVDVERQMQSDRDEAWSWFVTELRRLARSLMYDLEPVAAAGGQRASRRSTKQLKTRTTAEVLGESDPTLRIPAATVREAMTRAGGGTGLEVIRTTAGGVQLRTQAGLIPAGGVATGQTVLTVAADQGFPVDWFEWQHGSPARPFEPHLQLDGVTFYGEQDPNVANDEDWPDTAYFFPGDHAGCTCSAVPVFGNGPDRTTEDSIG